jgi:hypothetical protein
MSFVFGINILYYVSISIFIVFKKNPGWGQMPGLLPLQAPMSVFAICSVCETAGKPALLTERLSSPFSACPGE